MKLDKNIKIRPFAEQVYQITKKIKVGQVATYRQIAQAIGKPLAARAVGQVLHNNPFVPQVPCHRVIKSDGRLGGFARGSKKKLSLLRQEGIIIKNNSLDLNKYQAKL
ncbi:MAG TPA: MGMT family protein [bacterium]|nr:MGMT family protein [bacterium]